MSPHRRPTVRFTLAALIVLAGLGCSPPRTVVVVRQFVSPDSSRVVRVYEPAARADGSVQEFRVDVRQRSTAWAPNEDYVFSMTGPRPPIVIWMGAPGAPVSGENLRLCVAYPSTTPVLRRLQLFETTAVHYVPLQQTPESAGLWDAHTHLSVYGEAALDSLVAHDVVAVRDCGGDLAMLKRWRDEITAGKRRGPKIYLAGPTLDGPKEAPYRCVVTTPEQARRAVDSLATLGVDFIKTHNAVPPAAYFAVLRQARARHLPVASHLPAGVPAWVAADSGVASLEHAAESMLASPGYAGYTKTLREAADWWLSAAGDSALQQLARTHVTFTPTLAAYRVWAQTSDKPETKASRMRVLRFQQELTLLMHRAGIPIMAGSDFADLDFPVIPGKSLRDELLLLVEAGLTPEEALATATSVAESWFGERSRP